MNPTNDIRVNVMPGNSILFFTIMGLASYYTFVNSHTLFVHFPLRWLSEEIKYLSLFLSALLLFVSISLYDSKKVLVIFSSAILALFVAWNSGWEFYGYVLWIYFVLIIGSRCIEFRKIIKFHLILNLCFCLINILADINGWTDKTNIFLADERVNMFDSGVITRWSSGYPASTDFATQLLYILLDYWILLKGKMNLWMCSFILIAAYLSFFLCDARQALVCILLLFLFAIWVSYLINQDKKINKKLSTLFALTIPFLFTVTLFATLSYDETNPLWLIVDLAFSGRLSLGLDGIKEYGITWFGNNFFLVGAGYSGADLVYNYIDSTYIQFLLRWGIIVMTIFLLNVVKIGIDAFKRNDNTLLLSLFVAGMSSVTTQFLLDINYCVLVLAVTALHVDDIYKERNIFKK